MSTNPEALLAETDWLRALAVRLVHDRDAADEILHDTWLTALEKPPRSADGARSWLVRVLKRKAVHRGMREGRRREIESRRSDRRQEAAPPDVLERLALQRDLVDAVLALPEATARAILLRYYEDVPPREIARRTGVPVATVKSRIQRGLADVRSRLEHEYGGRGGWRMALAPLLAGAGAARAKASSGAATAVKAATVIGLGLAGIWGVAAWRSGEEPAAPELPAARSSAASLGRAAATRRAASSPDAEPARPVPGARGAPPPATAGVGHEASPASAPKSAVRVVDAAGREAGGVPLVVMTLRLDEREVIWRGTTGADGSAADLGPALDELRRRDLCEEAYVTLGFPCLGAPRASLEPGQTGVVGLALPATGSLRLTILDHDGGKPSHPLEVTCNATVEEAAPALRERGFLTPWRATATAGLEIPHVGPGLIVVLSLRDPSGARPATTLVADGPRAPGETRELTVRLRAPHPRLRGRVLDERGRPRRNERLALVVTCPRRLPAALPASVRRRMARAPGRVERSVVDVDTDAEGRFDLAWAAGPSATAGRTLTFCRAATARGHALGPAATLPLGGTLAAEGRDLGDVMLSPRKPVLAGRVVDGRGEPIAGASVTVTRTPEDEPAREGRRERRRLGRPATLLAGETDSSGRFELHGTVDVERLLLSASAPGCTGKAQVVSRGRTDVAHTLARGGAIAGSLRLDGVRRAWSLAVRARVSLTPEEQLDRVRSGGSPGGLFPVTGTIRRDGSFLIVGAPAGRVRVEIVDGGEVRRTFDDIEVTAGATVAPPSLRDVGLEPARTLELTLVTPEGRPLFGRRVHYVRESRGRFSTQRTGASIDLDDRGSCFLTELPLGAKSIELAVFGFRPVAVPLGAKVQRVTLERGPRVRLVVSGDAASDATEIVIRRVPDDGRRTAGVGLPPIGLEHRVKLAAGVATLDVSHAGRYQVAIVGPRAPRKAQIIEIEDGAEARVLTLR